jgi:phosphoribosylformylglycinamidine synthase
VITAIGHVPDADRCITPVLSQAGNVLVQLGTTSREFAGSHLDLVNGTPDDVGSAPAPDPDAPARYRNLHRAMNDGLVQSCHDLSEGGLAVTLAELCIAGRLGAEIDAVPHDSPTTGLFSESQSRLVVEIAPDDVGRFSRVMHEAVHVLGRVIDEPELRLPDSEPIRIEALADAFNRIVVPGSSGDAA